VMCLGDGEVFNSCDVFVCGGLWRRGWYSILVMLLYVRVCGSRMHEGYEFSFVRGATRWREET